MLDKRQEEYLERLAAAMRTRGFSAELVGLALMEAEALLEEIDGDPWEVCGQPREFADKVEAHLQARDRDPAEALDEPVSLREKAYAWLEVPEERGLVPPENPALFALWWLWVAVLTLVFVAAGLALACVGGFVAFVGVREAVDADDVAGTVVCVLVASGGSAVACCGLITAVWVVLRTVGDPSGRTPVGRAANGVTSLVLSLFYFVCWVSLLLFGAVFTWNGLGPGRVAGMVMLAGCVVALVFFPRHIKNLTGHDAGSGGGGYYGGGV